MLKLSIASSLGVAGATIIVAQEIPQLVEIKYFLLAEASANSGDRGRRWMPLEREKSLLHLRFWVVDSQQDIRRFTSSIQKKLGGARDKKKKKFFPFFSSD